MQSASLSIVIPAFNEDENLAPLIESIKKALRDEPRLWEIIVADDGSTDGSHAALIRLAQDPHVRWLRLPHRGKANALREGFAAARGSIIVTLDADLQDDPQEILRMAALIEGGADLVCGWKQDRLDPYVRKVLPSKLFNAVVSRASGIYLHDHNCGLKAYRAEVAKLLPLEGQLHRFIPLLVSAAGFDAIVEMPVVHHKRLYGKTKYGPSRFFYGITGLVEAVRVARLLREARAKIAIA